jgi:GTPase Era involved in 16S rRNA processing
MNGIQSVNNELDISSLMNAHRDIHEHSDHSIKVSEMTQATVTGLSTTPEGQNPYLYNPASGLALCAKLIANGDNFTPEARLLAEIKQTIDGDFLSLAKDDDNTTGAFAYSQLKMLEQQLNEIVAFPHLEKYYTVAVGGSFSAGKSRFLNSVLGCPSLLPTDTTPTTSIPTYLSQGPEDSISALNFYRKKIKIDEDALKAICHAFNQKFGVTFSHLLQLISVERQSFKYPDLVFLDTPGYSKADNIVNSGHNTDENIAREHLRGADYLIWLVDQQNGTVPQQDIEFIQSLAFKQPILVVFSKADKILPSEIESIIAAARQDLHRAEIAVVDVIGYSAQLNREFSPSQQILTELFAQVSQGKNGSSILWRAEKVLKQYINYYESKRQTLSLTNGTINEIIYEESISGDKKRHLDDLHSKTKAQLDALTKQKQAATLIQLQLADQISQLCQLKGIELTMQPTSVALACKKGPYSSAKLTQATGPQTLTFDASMKGDMLHLSSKANLTRLKGCITKLSAVGVHVVLQHEPASSLDLIITKPKIKDLLGDIMLENYFSIGQTVQIQIVNAKRACITVELNLDNH